MHPDISIIVPVYKVEPYLPACLDSLLAQTKKEIEIIVIDDGSPDNCGRICDEYAAKDNRIRVIHQENRGLSAARNAGLDVAVGDFIMFVDSDDWVLPEFCETPYRLITEHDADIVMFGYERMKDGKVIPANRIDEAEGRKALREAILLIYAVLGDYVWNKIYRRELFDKIRFPEGVVYEDIGTTYQLILFARRIWFTPKKLYCYRFREESIVNTRSRQYAFDYHEMSMKKIRALSSLPDTQDIAEEALSNFYITYCMLMPHDPRDTYRVTAEKALMSYRPHIPDCYTLKRKALIVLFWYCRWLFDLICILWKRRVPRNA